jgi:hypothetical protein
MNTKSFGGKPSAIVRRATLNHTRSTVERVSAILLLLLSFLGTIIALHGGWGPVLSLQLSLAALLGGILLQGVLTWLEWAYGDRRMNFKYLGALAADTCLTIYGYGPVLVPILAPPLAARGIPEPALVAWLIVALVALVLAWYPESRLID